jgi:cellulose synthase/poly-beta-1,6-N-acetylglucosamine synthase-like glycosyltransferase
MTIVDAFLTLLAVLPCLVAGYLLVLTLASRRSIVSAPAHPRVRFDVVVPAHDEEAGIQDTVRSLLALDYPAELRRVVVVADNCGDATAERARAAGAEVLERTDPEHRGKGYALALAFGRALEKGAADAVVVVDADTVVTPNLLRAFAARLERGAMAVQAAHTVRNPDASWRTRLLAIAMVLVNVARSLGRERLGCSSGLKGNGMCFSTRLLREVPYGAFSIVEDLEYGIRVGLAGHRVEFAHEAAALSEMVTSASAARSQRRRWEQGRGAIVREWALPLAWRGLRRRDRVALDMAFDLLTPPLAQLAAAILAGLLVSVAVGAVLHVTLIAPWAWLAALVALLVYVVRGWWISGTGARGLGSLLYAPVYLAWKLATFASARRPPDAWVRTARERRPP